MPFRLKIDILGANAFNAALIGLESQVEDMRPVWESIVPVFREIFREQFDSEGSKGASGQWAPLSHPYAEIKAKKWGEQKILHASGKLEAALTGTTSETITDIQKKELAFGTSLKYARFHQTGTGRMPARPIVALSDTQTRRISKAVQLSLLEQIKRDRRITPELGVASNLIE